MKTNSQILKELQDYLGFRRNKDFAEFLEISEQTLSNWYSRNSFNEHTILQKCENINPSWLRTGDGSMLKNNTTDKKSKMDEELINSLKERNEDLRGQVDDLKKEVEYFKEQNKTMFETILDIRGKDSPPKERAV